MPDEDQEHKVTVKMEGIKPPKNLILTGDQANFMKYRQLFEIYLDAAGLTSAEESRKIAIFLNSAGEEAVEVFNTFKVRPTKLASLLDEFQRYTQPRKRTLINSYEFLQLKQ